MKHITYINRTALLSLLSLGFAASAVQAQQPNQPKPEDIEKSDPFNKGAAGTESKPAKDQGAEMLDAQARILFARGETEKAIALQTQAVEKAKETSLKFCETLAKYEGHPVDGPISRKLNKIIIPAIDFENTTLEEAVDFLRLQAATLDLAEADPAKKGLNFVIRKAKAAAPDAVNGNQAEPAVIPLPRIAGLHLRNIPLGTVLKYICDATHYRFKVDHTTRQNLRFLNKWRLEV